MSVNLTISLKHLNAVLAVLNRHIYETGDKDGVEPELVNFSGEHGDKMIIGGIGGESFIEGGFIEEGNESEVIEALERTNIGQGHKYIDILYARDFINKVETLLDNNKEMNRGEGEEEEAEEAQQEEEEEAEAEEEEEDADDDCYDDGDEMGGAGKRRPPRRRAISAPEYRRVDMGLRARVKLPAQPGKRAPRWQTGPELEEEDYSE